MMILRLLPNSQRQLMKQWWWSHHPRWTKMQGRSWCWTRR